MKNQKKLEVEPLLICIRRCLAGAQDMPSDLMGELKLEKESNQESKYSQGGVSLEGPEDQ